MESLIADGEILKNTEYIPFRYENSVVLTQEIWFGYGGIPLFSENIANVKQQLDVLKAPVPQIFNNEKELLRITKRLLNRMRYFRSGIITLNVFAGKAKTHFLVKAIPFDDFVFPISQKGIQLNFAELIKFSKNPYSAFAFFNVPVWNIAAVSLINTPYANTLFLNEDERVTECIGANIFAVKGRELFTPSKETGCYIDTIRKYVLTSEIANSLIIKENSSLTKETLLQMDEVFIASEKKGIEWVMGIGSKRFVHQVSDAIHLKINEKLKEKAG